MADFSKPVSTDSYANVLSYLKATTNDLALGLDSATTSPTNVPTNAVRWSSVNAKWQKWNGTTWSDLSSLYAINISGNAATATSATSATSATTATTATNLAAGSAGAIPYQTGAGATSFSGVGVAGQAMLSGGSGVPTWGTLGVAAGGTGATSASAALVNLGAVTGTTGSSKLPAGTTAQRDASPATGYMRFNTDTALFEGYTGNIWTTVGAQSSGILNKLVNPRMEIDQRNNGASVTPTATATANYTLDRWCLWNSQASKLSIQQNAGSVTPPPGFTKYLGVTSASSYFSLATDYFFLAQPIEGLNITDLAWGTASAASVALTFRVYSNLTGTFSGSLKNGGATRSYPFTFAVNSANTWTTISMVIPGDTTGIWATDNTVGVYVEFDLGTGSNRRSSTAGSWQAGSYDGVTGSVSVVGTSGATFYVTGFDLRKSSVIVPAANLEWKPYGTELALCQRYYEAGDVSHTFNYIGASAITDAKITAYFAVEKRATPTITTTNGFGAVSSTSQTTKRTTLNFTSGTNNNFTAIYTASAEL